MDRNICIHGRFYQPPRENAWLEYVEQQDSAQPFHDWNELVTTECYAPNGKARILDDDNNIERIVNNYARISFNFGPTLLAWMAENDKETYRVILEADQQSRSFYSGHGSAIAQSYNHTILPLSNSRDKYTQLLWGVRDFQFRFGRDPEGMWLPETAVDLETLDILARLGIRFTILSPYQAKRIRRLRARTWKDVSGGSVDPTMAYDVRLPSGAKIAVFFYDGAIAHAIAFQGLLNRGSDFAERLVSAFSEDRNSPQLVHVATDGETYGHHHKYGDMALAYALRDIEERKLATLTNYGEYLERHPPTYEAEIIEGSAWSCSHGVERWNSHCGCNSGRFPTWNQHWRAPLRQALDWLRDTIAPKFDCELRKLLRDPWEARNDYINVILDRRPDRREAFFAAHALHPLSAADRVAALKLLEIQRHAMLMYTSSGWFFDELSGIETVQTIQYAARAIQLYETMFDDHLEATFLNRLESAKSNIPEFQDGRVVYTRFIKPAMVDRREVAAHYVLRSLFEPYPEHGRVHCYTVDGQDLTFLESGLTRLAVGRGRITSEITLESETLSFAALYLGDHSMNAGVTDFQSEENYRTLKQELIDTFGRAEFQEVIRTLDRHFGRSTYSLRSIFHDDQRKILNIILKSKLTETERRYRQLHTTHASMMRFLADLRVPLPRGYRETSMFAVNSNLCEIFEDPEKLDFAKVQVLLAETRANKIALDSAALGFALSNTIALVSKQFRENPYDLQLIIKLERAAELAGSLPFEVSVWRAQNDYYYSMMHTLVPEHLERAKSADINVDEWVERYLSLGSKLFVNTSRFRESLPAPATRTQTATALRR